MNIKKQILTFVIAFIAIQLNAQMPNVKVKGAMNKMGNAYDLNIWLDTISNKSHLYGMGPYDKMKGEITVVDGTPYFASAFVEGAYDVGKSWDIRSPFFVYSNVNDWEVFKIEGDFNSVHDIQEKVALIAKENGYDVNQPFAFKIEGNFDALTAHIVTPRLPDIEGYREGVKSQKFSFENTKEEFIGFYSTHHQGVFTHMDGFVHVHFLKADKSFMGHLDNINSGKGTYKLYLPKHASKPGTEIRVNDTDFSKGRLGHVQNIKLDDLTKFHGHLCDGLVVGQLALQQALSNLYPDGIVDRTNTRIVSQPSPCLTDAAIYMTGGRYQYNTFYVSKNIDDLFIVQRIDNGKTVSVKMNKGVKPAVIDEMGARAVKGELVACDLDTLKQLEDDFTEKLLESDPKEYFTVSEITDFRWNPELKNNFLKTDIINKSAAKCSQ